MLLLPPYQSWRAAVALPRALKNQYLYRVKGRQYFSLSVPQSQAMQSLPAAWLPDFKGSAPSVGSCCLPQVNGKSLTALIVLIKVKMLVVYHWLW